MSVIKLRRFMLRLFCFGQVRRSRIYDRLITYLQSGLAVFDALEAIRYRFGSTNRNYSSEMVGNWKWRMGSGQSLGTALGAWAPFSERVVLAAADKNLETALASAMALSESKKALSTAIRKAVIGAVFSLIVGIVVMLFFGLYIFPDFAAAYPIDKWPDFSKTVYSGITGFIDHWLVISLGIGAFSLLVAWALPNWISPARRWVEKIPVIGFPFIVYRQQTVASFFMSLSALLASGVALVDAVNTIHKHGSRYLRSYSGRAHNLLSRGADERTALMHPILPIAVADDVYAMAGSTDFPERSRKIADSTLKYAIGSATTQGQILAGIILLSVAALALTMYLALMFIGFDISDNVSSY